jgi:hypothetical protein
MLNYCLPHLQRYVFQSFAGWEIDFFVHTWRKDEDGSGELPFEGRGNWHQSLQVFGHGTGLALFKPRSYFLENYDDRKDLHSLPRAYSMFYSIKRANDARIDYERLLETKYDLVMRYRTDCILNESLYDSVKEYLKEQKPFLCIPKARRIPGCDGPVESDEYGICDWIAIGTPDLMNIYCGTYQTFVETGLAIVPESMLAMQLKSHNIKHETTLRRPLYDFFLIEGNGQIRGLESALKQSLKSPEGSEER